MIGNQSERSVHTRTETLSVPKPSARLSSQDDVRLYEGTIVLEVAVEKLRTTGNRFFNHADDILSRARIEDKAQLRSRIHGLISSPNFDGQSFDLLDELLGGSALYDYPFCSDAGLAAVNKRSGYDATGGCIDVCII